jgi:aspartate/methionine/tyrosine aminotransferase
MPPEAVAAVNDALDREETHYTDRPGILALRERAAAYLNARFATAFSGKSELVITCGVTEARFVTVQQLCRSGDTMFSATGEGAIIGPAILRGVSLGSGPGDAVLLHVASSRSEETIRGLLAQTPASAFILFEVDESASSFHPASVEGFADRTVTIGGILEDSVLSGARVGYLASPAKPAPGLRDFKQALTICTTNLSQWAALAAWQVQ